MKVWMSLNPFQNKVCSFALYVRLSVCLSVWGSLRLPIRISSFCAFHLHAIYLSNNSCSLRKCNINRKEQSLWHCRRGKKKNIRTSRHVKREFKYSITLHSTLTHFGRNTSLKISLAHLISDGNFVLPFFFFRVQVTRYRFRIFFFLENTEWMRFVLLENSTAYFVIFRRFWRIFKIAYKGFHLITSKF